MQLSARYLAIFLMILGFLASPASSVFAANAKPLSDLQLDDSRLNDEDIVCWSLEEDDPRLGADERPYFVLKPGIDTVKSDRSKKTFLLAGSKNGKKNTDNLVALRGDEILDAKKSSDIPFSPEVLEISRTDRPGISGVACSFVGGPRARKRISELIGGPGEEGRGPGRSTPTRPVFSKGPNPRYPRHQLFNPCF